MTGGLPDVWPPGKACVTSQLTGGMVVYPPRTTGVGGADTTDFSQSELHTYYH